MEDTDDISSMTTPANEMTEFSLQDIRGLGSTSQDEMEDDSISREALIAVCVIVAVLWLIGVTGNVVVIRVTWCRRYKSGFDLLVVTLAIIDLWACAVLLPHVPFNVSRELNDIHHFLYLLNLMCVVFLSAMLLVTIAIDRYCCICRYKGKLKTRTLLILIAFDVLAAASIVILFLIGRGVSMYFGCAIIVLLFVVMTVLYTCIFYKLFSHRKINVARPNVKAITLKNEQNETKNMKLGVSFNISKVVPAPPSSTGQVAPSADVHSGDMLTLNVPLPESRPPVSLSLSGTQQSEAFTPGRQTNQTGSRPIYNWNHMKKTAQAFLIITLVFVASFLPYFLAAFDVIDIPRYYVFTYYLNNVANPLVYSFLSQRFRSEARDVIMTSCCMKRCFQRFKVNRIVPLGK